MAFLERQGFNVTRFWTTKAINTVGQDTIDMFNAADLVIIGRSGPSSFFQQDAARVAWNAITAPVMLICPWKARSSRLRWFNSTDSYHEDYAPPIAYGKVADPTDPIFANANVAADSTIDWFAPPPHDFIRIRPTTTTTNAEIVATYNDSSILIARFAPNVRFYPQTADSAAGPRTYMGLGNDNVGWANFFPFTKNAKAVYLAEICRMMGIPVQEPVFAPVDNDIIFISDDLEEENMAFLERQGFNVKQFWTTKAINTVGQDTIDMFNNADLVIIGRSGPSSSFQQDAARVVWNAIESPLLLICPWKARSSRLRWFNSTDSYHEDYAPEVAYAKIADPTDVIFADADVAADSTMDWFSPPPHDFIRIRPTTTTTNAEIVATYNDSSILIARFDPNVRFYPETADSAAGPRSYMGLGNDNVGWANFFPFTKNAKKVYLAEICRMLGIEAPEIVYGPSDMNITFIAPYDPDREAPHRNFLTQNGFKVKHFWLPNLISTAGQDTIDMLNASDLVIIGRSGPSSSFQQDADRIAWNGLTAPVMLICQWKARSSRLRWFNSTDVQNTPNIALGKAELPADIIFSNVTLDAGDTLEWSIGPNDFMRISPVATPTNAEVVVSRNDSMIVVARFEPNVPFHPATTDAPAGPRSYIGMGADGNNYNFFPLMYEAQQVYFNELCRMLGLGIQDVVTASIDATLSAINYDAATAVFDPAFDPAVTAYTLTLTEEPNTVTVTGVANNANATVTGGGLIDVTDLESENVNLVCRAESGNQLNYRVTVEPYIPVQPGFEDVAGSHINMFPNPVSDVLNITSVNPKVRITVYNTIGKVVMEHNADNNLIQLDVSNLDAGIYLIRMEDSENILTGKFCKE